MEAIAIQGLVRRLLTQEAAESRNQDSSAPEFLIEDAERVLDKLRLHLSQRIGQEGFRVLLARSLGLAAAQFPALSAVRVGADGSLVGLGEAAGSDLQETNEGAAALVAHLIGLLVSFIGEDLTLRILGTVWPKLASDDTDGAENEQL